MAGNSKTGKPEKDIFNRLGEKQKHWARLVDVEGFTGPEAAERVYDVTTRESASSIASKNNTHPVLTLYRETHVKKALNKVVNLVDSKNPRVALDASKDILDRTSGKPIQRNINENVNLNIEALMEQLQ